MRHNVCGGILALALLVGAKRHLAAAQETGTPIFKAPYRAFDNHEFGVSLSDPGEGVSLALEGFYRYGRAAPTTSAFEAASRISTGRKARASSSAATSVRRS